MLSAVSGSTTAPRPDGDQEPPLELEPSHQVLAIEPNLVDGARIRQAGVGVGARPATHGRSHGGSSWQVTGAEDGARGDTVPGQTTGGLTLAFVWTASEGMH